MMAVTSNTTTATTSLSLITHIYNIANLLIHFIILDTEQPPWCHTMCHEEFTYYIHFTNNLTLFHLILILFLYIFELLTVILLTSEGWQAINIQ